MANNARLGMTVQKYICEKYGVSIPPEALAQFISGYDPIYLTGLESVIDQIFRVVGCDPVECLTYTRSEASKELQSPHNFVLLDGRTLSIRTNHTGDKVAPRVVGQCGIDTFNDFFSNIAGHEIEDKQQIKKVVYDHIDKMIPTFLDYLFVSDHTVWLRRDESGIYGFTIFDRNHFIDIVTERELFTFTKDLDEWNESTTLKYKGVSIAEIQIHRNRTFKFRFIMKALQTFLVEAKLTTETLGMTAEKVICDMFRLGCPDSFHSRYSIKLQAELTPVVAQAFTHLPRPVLHTGSEVGLRGSRSKCAYDFLLEGEKTLSLKTNTGKMVCPPEVGQPGAGTCYLYFGHLTESDHIDELVFKQMVLSRISDMLPIYVSHLFDSDFILWIYKKNSEFTYEVFDSGFAASMTWDADEFSFTRPTLDDWNESNTLRYAGIPIGEFQVHRSRSCYKFRFHMENLKRVIKECSSGRGD